MMSATSTAASPSSSAAVAGSSIATTKVPHHYGHDHSGYSSYSPLGCLARQYAEPVGKRVLLFVRTNPNVYLAGGVEKLLKSANSSKVSNASSTVGEYGSGADAASAASSNSATNGSSGGNNSNNNNNDPFAFLTAGDDSDDGGPESSNAKEDSNHKRTGHRIGKFLKKAAKNTGKALERGMTNLAIRADGGKSPDWFVIGLYDAATGAVLSMTESKPIPMDESKKFSGLRFQIPLVIPSSLASADSVWIKVWIRSGAAMIHNRHYLIGQTPLLVQQLRDATSNTTASFMTVTLQSNLVADGKLFLCATPDPKFPALCGPGWSLADPDVRAYGAPPGRSTMFHLPLDQSYGMPFPPSPSSCWLIATERSIESTVVLPIAAAWATLCAAAARISMQHSESVSLRVHGARHDSTIGDYVDCSCILGFLTLSFPKDAAQPQPEVTAFCAASWQRPDSIFEVDLLQPVRIPTTAPAGDWSQALSFRFFPKPIKQGILPALLQRSQGQLPAIGYCLGAVRLQITISRAHHHHMLSTTGEPEVETWYSLVQLEPILQRQQAQGDINKPVTLAFPVHNSFNQQVGTITVALNLRFKHGPPVPERIEAKGGLLSLIGLTPLCDPVQPEMDVVIPEELAGHPERLTRQQHQLATMGMFFTHGYTNWHCKTIRGPDVKEMEERATRYNAALTTAAAAAEDLPSHEDRSPKPFRPSSSRPELLLAGIPFNVHTASLSLSVVDQESTHPDKHKDGVPGSVFCNVTCGAPADHAREFRNIFPKSTKEGPNNTAMGLTSPLGPVSGGLRRLEAKRAELAKAVSDLQLTITMQVANYFIANQGQAFIPARHDELQSLRWNLFEAVQSLHHVEWHCAMRRSSCFSQALGTAVTSFLASLSTKWQTTWPELWAKHGYLVTFEGLLSAAGKELGMIEDASVGINMLRYVSIIFRSDDNSPAEGRVPVIASPYLKWVKLIAAHTGLTGTIPEYVLEIGVVPAYYDQRIPKALQNGTPVRLYPLLFEVGVDINQWRVHAMKKGPNRSESGGSLKDTETPQVSILDDEDVEEGGFTDDDVLVELNYEAYNKLNTYAHSISPAISFPSTQKTHPLLENLYQHIVTSSGKMNHVILDEAAALSHQLGGGGIVFCKSGKDRTAMHVTYKQAQYTNRFRQRNPSQISGDGDGSPFEDETNADASIMRIYGTRLPICEKNVGQAKYAFNSLQVKFMPDALKPPSNTLAGFLKGGKVFQGGAIES